MSLSPEQLPPRILIVDDEEFVREAIELYFSTEGFQTLTACNGNEALQRLEEEPIDLAILDIMMPGMDGIQLLREIKKFDADIEVVMASGCGTIESAIESMRLGAYDYVTKPILNFDEDLLKVVRKALERRKLLASNRKLSGDLKEINRELKEMNGRLKRHVIELEVLYENGKVLGELATLEQLTAFTMQTIEHQLHVAQAILVTQGSADGSWLVQGTAGVGGLEIGDELAPMTALLAGMGREQQDLFDVDSNRLPESSELLRQVGAPPESMILVAPLRAQGDTHGYLVVVTDKDETTDERTRLLRLIAAQIAAPVRLLRKEMTA
ncbi:MAG: response regulator [Planctomycetota bacterium]